MVITCFPKKEHFDILYLNAVKIAVFNMLVFLQVFKFHHPSLDLDCKFTLPMCFSSPRNSSFLT